MLSRFGLGVASRSALLQEGKLAGRHMITRSIVTAGPPKENTFSHLFEQATAKNEHKDLIILPFQDVRHTFSECKKALDAYATGFVMGRLHSGARFVSCAPDNHYGIYAFLASFKAGIIYVPLPHTVGMEKFVDTLKKTDARGLLMPQKMDNRSYYTEWEQVIPEAQSLQMEDIFKFPRLPNLRVLLTAGTLSYPAFSQMDVISVTHPIRNPLPKIAEQATPDTPVLYLADEAGGDQYTVHTHGSLIRSGKSLTDALHVTSSDRVSLAVPHTSGIFYPLIVGCIEKAAAYIQPNYKFTPETTLNAIHRDKATILFIQASNLNDLFAYPRLARMDLSTLRTVVVVGEHSQEQATKIKEHLKPKEIITYSSNVLKTSSGDVHISSDKLSKTYGKPAKN